MKTLTYSNKATQIKWSPFKRCSKNIIISALFIIGFQISVQAQDNSTKPSWWFGGAAGANFNYYNGSTHKLNAEFTPPAVFHKGFGIGLFAAPLIEFHRADSRWGVMLQAGYDSRRGSFKKVVTPCNCPADLITEISYFTIEPSLRIAPFKSNFYLYVGPRIALNLAKSFTYQQDVNPDVAGQIANPDVKGDLSDINSTLVSMQVGMGYDIPLTAEEKRTQLVLSPFVSFQPYFGQTPRSIETWNVTTLRAGIALKFGVGHKSKSSPKVIKTTEDDKLVVVKPVEVKEVKQVKFTVVSPKNISVDRRVSETFPLRNYIFFDMKSTEIPNRYVKLTKDQVKDFKEDQLEVYSPKSLSGRSNREMIVYYNIINILGDRMQKNPSSTITLIGASENGPEEGTIMAGNVKKYLVTVFGINATRIAIEGRKKPKIPSQNPGVTSELALRLEGDRRVTIESSSSDLLMEFQSGPNAPLKPVVITTVQEAPLDSYVTFKVDNATIVFTSWNLEIKDDKGVIQNYGPYTKDKVSIPGKTILGTIPEGKYKVTMIGKTPSGNTITKDTTVNMVLWTIPKREMGMRYSVIYEFNKSKSIAIYEKYLTEIVTPKIPVNGVVIIHGYTDIIGDENNNVKLSMARANDVKKIMEKALAKKGRKDVKFEVYGFGEDTNLSPFENKYPEERFYNRTVIIDIIPAK